MYHLLHVCLCTFLKLVIEQGLSPYHPYPRQAGGLVKDHAPASILVSLVIKVSSRRYPLTALVDVEPIDFRSDKRSDQ